MKAGWKKRVIVTRKSKSNDAIKGTEVHLDVISRLDLRLMYTAIVENKTGIGKSQARLLGFQIKLHNLVVT